MSLSKDKDSKRHCKTQKVGKIKGLRSCTGPSVKIRQDVAPPLLREVAFACLFTRRSAGVGGLRNDGGVFRRRKFNFYKEKKLRNKIDNRGI